MKKRALILANGQPPSKRILSPILNSVELFVCADGGANAAARMGLKPDLIIGDLDSISPQAIRKFRRVRTRASMGQNSTDLEKAIKHLLMKGYRELIVAGATGGRLDHEVGNLSALAKFSKSASISFVEDAGEISCVGNEFTFESPVGRIVSLIPLSRCEGIVTQGLKWDLNNESLELGIRESTSNRVVSSPVHIRVRRGNLLLYKLLRPHSTTKKKISRP